MTILSAFLLSTIVASSPEGHAAVTSQVRAAVQRSVSFIEEKGQWWIDEKNCSSCHRVGPMVWSLSAARQRGFTVSEKLDAWIDWAVETYLAADDKGKVAGSGDKEGVAQVLLMLDETNAKSVGGESLDRLARLIIDGQQADGSWKPGGQLPSQKRPATETADVSTMWLALSLIGRESVEGSVAAVNKATDRIKASPAGKSTEWYVSRLLVAQRANDSSAVQQMVEALRSQQNPDGGWGWLVGETSDALGTGMGLYALVRTGSSADDATIQRAQQFLVATQRDEGSWAVK
jgi:squalene-hopene/tetraprenyl-beta-curcumene cyclase